MMCNSNVFRLALAFTALASIGYAANDQNWHEANWHEAKLGQLPAGWRVQENQHGKIYYFSPTRQIYREHPHSAKNWEPISTMRTPKRVYNKLTVEYTERPQDVLEKYEYIPAQAGVKYSGNKRYNYLLKQRGKKGSDFEYRKGLPANWKAFECKFGNVRKLFYHNSKISDGITLKRGVTVSSVEEVLGLPKNFKAIVIHGEIKSYYNTSTKKTTYEDPAYIDVPNGWKVDRDDNGHVYYFKVGKFGDEVEKMSKHPLSLGLPANWMIQQDWRTGKISYQSTKTWRTQAQRPTRRRLVSENSHPIFKRFLRKLRLQQA